MAEKMWLVELKDQPEVEAIFSWEQNAECEEDALWLSCDLTVGGPIVHASFMIEGGWFDPVLEWQIAHITVQVNNNESWLWEMENIDEDLENRPEIGTLVEACFEQLRSDMAAEEEKRAEVS